MGKTKKILLQKALQEIIKMFVSYQENMTSGSGKCDNFDTLII